VNVSGITRSAPQRPQRINAAALFHQFVEVCVRYRTKVDGDPPDVRLRCMSDTKRQMGRALRFVASGGWTTEDPDVMPELLDHAEELARAVVADGATSPDVRALAEEFLERLKLDTLG
jgi:hypothetical protein